MAVFLTHIILSLLCKFVRQINKTSTNKLCFRLLKSCQLRPCLSARLYVIFFPQIFVLFKTTKIIWIKPRGKRPWINRNFYKECSNEEPRPFKRGDNESWNNEKHVNWRDLKFFSPNYWANFSIKYPWIVLK